MIPEHTFHVKVLNTDGAHLAVVRQLMSNLMNIVKSLVGNLGVNTGDMMLNLLPSERPLRLMTQFPLVMLQTFFSRLGKMRSREFTTIGADSKGFHTGVNTDGCACVNSSTGLLTDGCVNKNGSVVLPVRIHRDCYVLDLAIKASVKNDRDILALGDAESLMLPVDGAVLRIVERLPVLLAFEQRVSSSMLPPVLESVSYLLDGILQRLRVDLTEPRVDFLQGGELLLGAEATYTDSSSAPHHRHVVKRAIIRHTATAEALREELRLILIRIKPVFISSQHITNLLILYLIINKQNDLIEDAVEGICDEEKVTWYTNVSRIKRKTSDKLGKRAAEQYIIKRGEDGLYRISAKSIA